MKVLLIEDHPADAWLVRSFLRGAASGFELHEVVRLADGLEALREAEFDVVLLDLGLPDSIGLATFATLHARHRALPVVVLSGLDDESAAINAVRLGAQDYLVKGKYDEALLVRAIRYAIERQRWLMQLESALGFVRHQLADSGPAGRLALCSWCWRLQDEGRWQTIEEFLSARTRGSRALESCPECAARVAALPEAGP